MSFFCPFSILITVLGEGGAGLCAYRAFVSYAHVNLRHFSLPPVVRGLLPLLLVALPGHFCLPFFRLYVGPDINRFTSRSVPNDSYAFGSALCDLTSRSLQLWY